LFLSLERCTKKKYERGKMKMCEFKVMKQNNNTQIAEEILVLSYNENNELLLKDILGMGKKLDSALILDVNTLTQKCVILEHPLINEIIGLMKDMTNNSVTKDQIENVIKKFEDIKNNL